MLYSLPNPTKSITFDFPEVAVRTAINTSLTLPEMSKYKFMSKNDILGEWTFHCFEFLSTGVNVVINISDSGDSRTNVSIEVQRVIGTFDQTFEVNKAKDHLTNWFTAIGKLLTTPYVAPPTYNTTCPHCHTNLNDLKPGMVYSCNSCKGYLKLDENHKAVPAEAPAPQEDVKANSGCVTFIAILMVIGLIALVAFI